MRIAIIGTGKVGSALGTRWAQNGHQIIFGSRTPASKRVEALIETVGPNATATMLEQAATDAEVVVLATRYSAVEQVIKKLGALIRFRSR